MNQINASTDNTPQEVNSLDLLLESFIMSYDGPHEAYFQELIEKTNKKFGGTYAEIPARVFGEIQGNLIKRMALVSTIANDSNLRSAGFYPITAAQSENLWECGKLSNPKDNWEDLGIILYDRSQNGANPKWAQAIYDSLRNHRQDFGLSESDLEDRLIVVNLGAEVDSSMPYRIKPILIPGITQVYQHEALENVERDPIFTGYASKGGLPLFDQMVRNGNKTRTLYMPEETSDIGLRVLNRCRDISLDAGSMFPNDSIGSGRINFSRIASHINGEIKIK